MVLLQSSTGKKMVVEVVGYKLIQNVEGMFSVLTMGFVNKRFDYQQ